MHEDETTDDPEEVSIPDDVLDEIAGDDAEDDDEAEGATPAVAVPVAEEEPEEVEALLTTEEEPEDVDFDTHDDIDPI